MLATLFNQSFDLHDIIVVLLLIVLEGMLSVDNALVLGLMAKRLPPEMRQKALTYGLIGAFAFRVIAIGFAAWLLHYPVVKLFGGAYLIYVALKHFLSKHHDTPDDETFDDRGHALHEDKPPEPDVPLAPTVDPDSAVGHALAAVTPGGAKYANFWPSVVMIEITDVAFAVDSILAALAFIPPNPDPGKTNPKLWVVMLGGFIGVILMRVAAVLFIKLLEKFPRFETAAYLLVTTIGLKLIVDWVGNHYFADDDNPHPVNFHSPDSVAFWAFWLTMAACFAVGFMGEKKPDGKAA